MERLDHESIKSKTDPKMRNNKQIRPFCNFFDNAERKPWSKHQMMDRISGLSANDREPFGGIGTKFEDPISRSIRENSPFVPNE